MLFLTFSDLHYGVPQSEKTNLQQENVDRVIKFLENTKVDFIAILGDLTHSSTNDQFLDFKTNCLERIESNGECKIYLVHGTHDDYYNPVPVYISQKYCGTGDVRFKWYNPQLNLKTVYAFKLNGVYFFMLGVYPDKIACDYFKFKIKQLKISTTNPIILMHHFAFDDYYSKKTWTESERTYYYNTIKMYNILAIYCGHYHVDQITRWNNIPVIQAAFSKFCKSEYNETTGKLTFELV